jgi:Protein of unknown function (DUF4230)
MDLLSNLLGLIICLALGAAIGWWFARNKKSASQTQIYSSIEELRAIGKLSVFKAITKEIITETDHTFGEFGRKYLSWVFSNKKLAMIFEFEVEFSYNLQHPDFAIVTDAAKQNIQRATIVMPPCEYSVGIRNLQFYDEKKAAFLPWLLPNLIGEAFGAGFDETDKNRLITSAREHAKAQAEQLILDLKPEVERSAKNTLSSLALSFNVKSLEITFKRTDAAIPLPIMLNRSDEAIEAAEKTAA